MSREFRVIDTGIRDGREQIAFDQAMIDLHVAGRIPDSVRFLRFPPTALIGRHQALSQELKLDYCRENNIRTVRRITGGGALYFDEGRLGSNGFHIGYVGGIRRKRPVLDKKIATWIFKGGIPGRQGGK